MMGIAQKSPLDDRFSESSTWVAYYPYSYLCRAVFGLDADVFADDLHLPLLGRDFRLVSVL